MDFQFPGPLLSLMLMRLCCSAFVTLRRKILPIQFDSCPDSSIQAIGGFVHDGSNILIDLSTHTYVNMAKKLTFRLYRVVILVASTSFLMLLVAR